LKFQEERRQFSHFLVVGGGFDLEHCNKFVLFLGDDDDYERSDEEEEEEERGTLVVEHDDEDEEERGNDASNKGLLQLERRKMRTKNWSEKKARKESNREGSSMAVVCTSGTAPSRRTHVKWRPRKGNVRKKS
jgi:hypothetical protein